jgi:hypothetical protein
VIFAIHLDLFSDHTELFKAVIREHHCNRDVGRVTSSGDNDAADSRLIVPGISSERIGSAYRFAEGLQTHLC